MIQERFRRTYREHPKDEVCLFCRDGESENDLLLGDGSR